MGWVKVFHFIFVFIWVGSLMNLTRMMIKHHSYDLQTREVLAGLYSRSYYYMQLPCMLMGVTLGMVLIAQLDQTKSLGWFHMKLAFAMGMIMCDVLCSRFVQKIRDEEGGSKGYGMVHGISGLLLLGIAISLYVVRQ